MPLGHLSVPPPGVVHLWYLDLGELGNPLRPDTDSSVQLDGRQQRMLRRFYLRLLLGAYLGTPGKKISISRLVKGKPVLSGYPGGRPLDFSMANSDGCCLIGISSEGLLGVDMERIDRKVGNPTGLARRYFSPAEAEAIAALDAASQDEAFLHTWACKEALVKGAGHGIADQLHRFTVSCDPRQPPRVLVMHEDDPTAWRLLTVRPSKRHIGVIALRHPELRLESFRLMPRG